MIWNICLAKIKYNFDATSRKRDLNIKKFNY